MSLLIHILNLRWLFVLRSVQSLGVVRQLVLAVLLIYGFGFLIRQWNSNPSPWFVSSIILVLMVQLHITRNDKPFLVSVIEKPSVCFFAEYSLLFLPIAVFFLIEFYWIQTMLVIGSLFFISRLTYSVNVIRKGKTLAFPFPDDVFEWKSGFRSKGVLVLILILAGFVFYHHNFVIPVVMFLNLLIISSFYTDCESNQLVQLVDKRPLWFLMDKYVSLLKLYWMFHAPVFLLFLFTFTELRLISLLVFLWFSFLLFIVILAKYAIFREKEDISGLHSFFVLFTSLAPLNVLLFPIPVGMGIVLLKKSLRNLKEICHA